MPLPFSSYSFNFCKNWMESREFVCVLVGSLIFIFDWASEAYAMQCMRLCLGSFHSDTKCVCMWKDGHRLNLSDMIFWFQRILSVLLLFIVSLSRLPKLLCLGCMCINFSFGINFVFVFFYIYSLRFIKIYFCFWFWACCSYILSRLRSPA